MSTHSDFVFNLCTYSNPKQRITGLKNNGFQALRIPRLSREDLRSHRVHSTLYLNLFSLFFKVFKRFYLFIFRERGREGEREGEKHECVVASHALLTGDLAHNPGMCPDWELNW